MTDDGPHLASPAALMQPLQLYDNKAVHIHLLGKSGPGYERPWKSANANNPLKAWAEKKSEEMKETQKGKGKKKD